MYRDSATIEDVYRLALPAGTELLAGSDYLNRPVTWACSLRPSPPAFPKLDGNELALIDMKDLRLLDPKMRLERVVRSLESARVAAIAVQGPFSTAVVKVAETSRLTLFRLAQEVPLIQIERSVIRLIADRAGYIAQRSTDLQRELNQSALDGGGLARIATHLCQFSQQPVVLLREDGQIVACKGMETWPETRRKSVLAGLPNIMSLRSWVVTQPPESIGEIVGVLPTSNGSPTDGVFPDFTEVAVAPIVAGGSARGYCVLFRAPQLSRREVTAVEEISILQGAAAAALEWAKQNAVDIAEARMRATFLDELLAFEIADEQAWIQRGASLNYDLNRPHVCCVVHAENIAGWPQPLLHYMDELGVSAPHSRRAEGLLLFWPVDNPKSGREVKAVVSEFITQVQVDFPTANIGIGLGRPAVGPAQWLESQRQALESWRLGKEWKGAPVTYFGDLGLYQLLTALGGGPEAARFHRKTLGRLIAHDDDNNAELVDTLDAFFVCLGNLSQTAGRLHIHRNTLAYRLDRISSITQLDLDDPDARFSLQLALKLRPIMK